MRFDQRFSSVCAVQRAQTVCTLRLKRCPVARFIIRTPLVLATVLVELWCSGGAALCTETQAVTPLPASLVERVLTPTEVLAFVGDQTILAGDILPTIDQALQDAKDKIPAHQLDPQRAMYVRQLLSQKIDSKLVLLDFYRTIPADKRDEALANIDKQVEEQFYQEQIPRLMEKLGVESLMELDNKYRSFGTSIDLQKIAFREQMIAHTTIRQNVEQSPEITHDELLDYYYAHIEDYKISPRAQWEQLTARFDRFPSKAAADRAIVEMGNQVLRGADFAAVAKKHSQGTNAWNGGFHDWTTKGSLLSEVVDHAIFALPLNHLSQKLEDERGFHIVRVLARQDATQITFEQAQDEIRETLQQKHREREQREYLEELRRKTYVWTIFDHLPD